MPEGTGRLLVVRVPKGDSPPYGTAEGLFKKRVGKNCMPLDPAAITRAIAASGQPDWLAAPAREPCSADEVVSLLDAPKFFELLKLPDPGSLGATLDRIAREDLLERNGDRWTITRLGAVLFAKRLTDFPTVSRKAPRVLVYDSPGKTNTRLDRTGNLGYALAFAPLVKLVNAQVPGNEVIREAIREEVKLFPPIAVREIVANAMVHQDFAESGMSMMVEIYPDRMEVSNPGVPPIEPSRFIDGYKSRNEKLAELMRRFGICEEKGSGFDRVVDAAEIAQLPAPDVRVGEHRTSVLLFAPKPFDKMDRDDRVRACYQHACLRYVMNQRMTNQTLRDRFKLPPKKAETVSRIIRDAVDGGLVRIGDPNTKSRRYAWYVPFWA